MLVSSLISKLEKLGAEKQISEFNTCFLKIYFRLNNDFFYAYSDKNKKEITNFNRITNYGGNIQDIELVPIRDFRHILKIAFK